MRWCLGTRAVLVVARTRSSSDRPSACAVVGRTNCPRRAPSRSRSPGRSRCTDVKAHTTVRSPNQITAGVNLDAASACPRAVVQTPSQKMLISTYRSARASPRLRLVGNDARPPVPADPDARCVSGIPSTIVALLLAGVSCAAAAPSTKNSRPASDAVPAWAVARRPTPRRGPAPRSTKNS